MNQIITVHQSYKKKQNETIGIQQFGNPEKVMHPNTKQNKGSYFQSIYAKLNFIPSVPGEI
jgi:hypothetical protein